MGRVTIYAAPEGTGDGKTVGAPIGLRDALASIEGRHLEGDWVVRLAAGTYPGSYRLTGVQSASRLTIAGPDVAGGEPAVVFDGGNDPAHVYGLQVVGGYVAVRDVAFRNYNPGKATGVGVVFQDGCDAWTVNVWATDCSFVGVYASGLCKIRVTGGTIVRCQRGLRAYNLTGFTFGYNGAAQRTTIRDCAIGVEVRDGAYGHLDYTDIDGCDTGVWVYQGSRVHPVACSVTNSKTVGVHVSSGGWWYNNRVHGTRYEGNTRDTSTGNGSSELSWGHAPQAALVDRCLSTLKLEGATTEAQVKRMRPLPGGWVVEPGAEYTIRITGVSDTPGWVAVRLNYRPAGSAPVPAGHFTATCRVIAVDATTQKVVWESSTGDVNVSTLNLPLDGDSVLAVAVMGGLSDAAGTLSVELIDCIYQPGTHAWTLT